MFYTYIFFFKMRCLHVNRNLVTLFCLTKRCQIQIIYQFAWKFYVYYVCINSWLSFVSSPSKIIFVSSLFGKNYVMFGLCMVFLLTRVPVWDFAPQVHSRVSNINFILLGLGLGGGGNPEIFPVCSDVNSMCCICIDSNTFVIGR